MNRGSRIRILKAGVVYFLIIFALGWILGPIRVLWAVSRFGRITALLLEGVIMLIAMFVLGPLGYLAIRCGPGTPDGDRDRLGGACDIAACRNRRCSVAARFAAARVCGELREHTRHHLAGPLPTVRGDAGFGHGVTSRGWWDGPVSFRFRAKALVQYLGHGRARSTLWLARSQHRARR